MALSPGRAAPALACALLLSGCATLLAPRHPSLPPPAPSTPVRVSDAGGRMPDTAPLDARLQPSPAPTAYSAQLSRPPARAASRRALTPAFYLDAAVPWVVALGLVTFRDEPGVLPALAVAIPSAMAVDLLTGAAWDRSPSAAPPPAPLPPPARSAQAPARDMDAEITADPALASLAATLLLRQMARAADAAGCNRVISEAWLDESELVRRPSAVSAADSVAVDERVEREVEEARAELGRLCARSNPLLDSLAAVQQLAARPATEPAYLESEAGAPEAPAAPEALCRAAAFGECITFPLFSAELPAGAGPGLDSLAARIRAVRLPVVVVIVGTADERGDPGVNRGLGHARATAVRDALVRRGVPADRLAVESCGSEARCQLVPGAAGESRGAELNRRVILQLRVRESTP